MQMKTVRGPEAVHRLTIPAACIAVIITCGLRKVERYLITEYTGSI